MLLPGMSLYHPALLTFVYSIALLYCFIGVSAAADKFMGGIEVITDQRYEEVYIYSIYRVILMDSFFLSDPSSSPIPAPQRQSILCRTAAPTSR